MNTIVPAPKHIASVSVMEYATMSRDVYDDLHMPLYQVLKGGGWQRIETINEHKERGFRARLFKRSSDGATVIAYRGTEPAYWNNINADIKLTRKKESDFLAFAESAYYSICGQYGMPLALTGHSLGGYLAQYVSIILREQAIQNTIRSNRDENIIHPHQHSPCALAFNAPHVGGLAHGILKFKIPEGAYNYIFHFRVENDAVSNVGKRVGQTHTLTPPPEFCSIESLQERQKKSWPTMSLQSDIGHLSDMASEHAVCAYQAHKMDMVLTRLQLDTLTHKEIFGIPTAPEDIPRHEHAWPEQMI